MMFANDDDMVECPYNKAHRMLRKRLQSHLLKCRIHYPDVELRKCPFNLSHLIPEPEFTHHVTNCPDRKLITQYKYDAPDEVAEEEHPKHEPIECEENWDDTDVADYDPKKYVENAEVIRQPEGPTPSLRKEFIKKERKRLGDPDSDDEDIHNEFPSSSHSSSRRLTENESYNCDDDPYYSSRSEQYIPKNRSHSPLFNRDRSYRSVHRNRSPKSYDRERSPNYYSRERSPKSFNRDRSPESSYGHRSPKQYNRGSPPSSSLYRDRSPNRSYRA